VDASRGPVVRGPRGFGLVLRMIDLGVFDSELEIADSILLWIVVSSLPLSMSCVALGLPWVS
jgi:hypothetical protein